ncbi:PQQ-dependent sugar dehydrogenase [Aquiflexum gelatinilyticum]|uniref:PQQ-dependent sugar dehydrogenase n=1 Tax=Aquiflexum gelatinilyticum TaxID=2961943 RepID=UPI002166E14D|nr:PQQ-dependent sugar dehydrogenase [Aquiflexum gelatinilyticum]MCS4435702.1 PQQ-dependent sugar dehydrogenase [Aquiflexum gelatinilyticum]
MKSNTPKWLILILFLLIGTLNSCTKKEESTKTFSGKDKPEDSRFTQVVVADGLEEPLQMDFDKQGFVYWIERAGHVKRINDSGGIIENLGTIPTIVGESPGMIGILLDKDFENTRHLFLYYSPQSENGNIMRLSRFTLGADNKFGLDSEIILLDIPWEQPDGSHFGGGMTWDKEGNLYLSVGGDSAPTQYAPLAFTNEGGRGEDEGRTSGNTNDLRGTILRIKPNSDGTYSIPEGNLFPQGTDKTRPEIYVMGNRNPWRLSIDSHTGYLHWGEVGPDAGVDSEEFGPMGYDEFNVAKSAGNFGWPYVIGKNLPYKSYDYLTKTFGDFHNPDSLVNTSPNNTGLKVLPPAQPPLVAYPYKVSDEWPILGSAARSAVGGPIFRKSDFSEEAKRVFPDYFEGKWLITDYVRNWIMVVTMDEDRNNVTSIERFLPAEKLIHSQPLDMDFGLNGDLYILEYGTGTKGRISRIEFNAGNRAPIAVANSEMKSGSIPFELQLSSEGSRDDDGDKLDFEWKIEGGETTVLNDANPKITLDKPGKYKVSLTVKDPSGASDSHTFEVVAGNKQPEVKIEITSRNKSFYFPDEKISYQVQVIDQEDGTLAKGQINPEAITVTAEYIPSGIDFAQLRKLKSEGNLQPETVLRHLNAKALISKNNCTACHQEKTKLVGPSFLEVAKRYKDAENVFDTLSKSIIQGGSGKWGEVHMPPQPTLSAIDTKQIIEYILDLASAEKGNPKLPLQGEFKTKAIPTKIGDGRLSKFYPTTYEMGSYVFSAHYTDQGSEEESSLNLKSEDFTLLRFPLMGPEKADVFSETGISYTPSTDDPGFIFTGKGGYIGFKDIDLTGINQISIGAITRFWHWSHFIGGDIELRLGSPEGTLVGEAKQVPPAPQGEKGPFFGDATGKPTVIDVSKIDGVHDLYILVKNSGAKESDALVIMTGIEFRR